MRFYTANYNNAVRLRRISVDIDRLSLFRIADILCLHTGMDGCAAKFLCNAVPFNNSALSFGGSASMTTHSRDNKGQRSTLLAHAAYLPNNQPYIGNAAASCGNSNAHTRLNCSDDALL